MVGLIVVISGDAGSALAYPASSSSGDGFCRGLCPALVLALGIGAVIGGVSCRMASEPQNICSTAFIVLFDHNYDVQGQGWQQTRSLLTIGGGASGTGYLHGTQSQAGVGSVPARHTDLIFAVIGEELGFVGATLSILLLVAIIIRVLVVGRRAAQPFHTYVCVGMPPW